MPPVRPYFAKFAYFAGGLSSSPTLILDNPPSELSELCELSAYQGNHDRRAGSTGIARGRRDFRPLGFGAEISGKPACASCGRWLMSCRAEAPAHHRPAYRHQ